MPTKYDAVLFDLLTALLDSWSLWNDVAVDPETGMAWRKAYLEVTYGCGAYRPYEDLVAEAAEMAGIAPVRAAALVDRWDELTPWPDAVPVLQALHGHVKLGAVTNCSVVLGRAAAARVCPGFDVVATAEEAGFYKPRREAYAYALNQLGTVPARTLFVAGSAADVPGAVTLGMPVYWHNRIGMPAVDAAIPDHHERTLAPLLNLI